MLHHFHLRRSAVWIPVLLLLAAAVFRAATVESAGSSESAADNAPMLALTFDDGPSTQSTGKILDILEVNGAKATFFVIGRNIAGHADVLVRAKNLGCEIGNHTYDHKKLSELSAEGIARQLQKTDEALEGILGLRPTLVRAPCGRYRKCDLAAVDRPIVLWSMDTEDWNYACNKGGNTAKNRDTIVRSVLENARDGDIILMHDIYSLTADCVSQIVPALRARGFSLVTVSEMMNRKCIEMHSGSVYHSGR